MLLSIGHAGGDRRWVRLDEVIATADGLNHLIPLAEEMQEGISNLIAAGLVAAKGLETRLTASGSDAFAQATGSDVGYIQQLADLEDAWQAGGYPEPASTLWALDEETWRQASETYEHAMEAMHPDLRSVSDDIG
ncbi:MAG: hypothetical protein ACJ765_02980 [Chloroflexota bacterium]